MGEQDFNLAKKATPRKAFSNKPCLTKEEMVYRVFCLEKPIIDRMIKKGYPIREIINYWSEATGECHVVPIFATDHWPDIVTRYIDLFPVEAKTFSKELEEHNKHMVDPNGMSEDRTLMAKLRAPIGLYRMLVAFDNNFWKDELNVKAFMKMFPKLSVVKR